MSAAEKLDPVQDAAVWIANGGPVSGRPVMPQICERFGLDLAAAIAAIRKANELRRDTA